MNEEKLKIALSVSDDHPVMQAILQVLKDTEEQEVNACVLPNLLAEDRAYNCGRAAAIKDLGAYIGMLRGGKELT